jgi:hypothetical protein
VLGDAERIRDSTEVGEVLLGRVGGQIDQLSVGPQAHRHPVRYWKRPTVVAAWRSDLINKW